MNIAALFSLHLKTLSNQGKPIPTNIVDAKNITLLRSVIASFSTDADRFVSGINTQHYTVDSGLCENIEIHFIDKSWVSLTETGIKVYVVSSESLMRRSQA
ncbi:hypothetical protein [Xanthomarina gelatinilytica]|uniref:hypothetical protein n=1 Tax=Xanthomarina gelatinilytica TaxID=1137281 RepID=UPI003AA7D04F